ncbi:MAG TPA: acyltransferase [Microthrixaceae bacterium]|nr:acyltransferase [Microthrixaceae bacterium]
MVEASPGDSGRRLRALDALRGIAAMAVVVFHYSIGFDGPDYFPGYEKALFAFGGGRYGVSLFFMISGFVILWSLERVRHVGEFAYSRFSRLFPPYWGSMLIVSAYILFAEQVLDAGIDDKLGFTWQQWLANLTMVPTWFGQPELDGAYWTLSVEMTFYLVVGVLYMLGLTKPNRIVWTLLGAWVLDVGLGSLAVLASGESLSTIDDFMYLFIAGMALFTLFQRPQQHRWIKLFLVFSVPLVDLSRSVDTAVVVGAAIVVTMYLAVFGHLRVLESKPLLWLGSISYSIYLVHAYPGYITIKLLLDAGWNRNLAILVAIAQTMVLAIGLNKLVEKPVTRWLRARRKRGVMQASVASA